MQCPRDNAPLSKHVYEANIEVDACPQCSGMYLDRGELEAIQENREHDFSPALKQMPDLIGRAYTMAHEKNMAPINCPSCQHEMSHHEYSYCSQVMIDTCPHCGGIWLDKGELQALEVFFERAHMKTEDIRNGFWRHLRELWRERNQFKSPEEDAEPG